MRLLASFTNGRRPSISSTRPNELEHLLSLLMCPHSSPLPLHLLNLCKRVHFGNCAFWYGEADSLMMIFLIACGCIIHARSNSCATATFIMPFQEIFLGSTTHDLDSHTALVLSLKTWESRLIGTISSPADSWKCCLKELFSPISFRPSRVHTESTRLLLAWDSYRIASSL